MTYDHSIPINYKEQSKEVKRKLIFFVRRFYPGTTVRDLYSGLHVVCYRGHEPEYKWSSIRTDLAMVAKYRKDAMV